MHITIFSHIYLLSALFTFMAFLLAWRRRNIVGAFELALLCFSVSFSAAALFFESAALTQQEKILCSQISYLTGVFIPVFYLLFSLRFTKQVRFSVKKGAWLLFVIPVFSIIMAFTNDYHHQLWSGFSPVNPKTNLIEYFHGWWFWIGYTTYGYSLLLISTVFLVQFYRNNRKKQLYKYQSILILMGGLLPLLASMFYLLRITPVKGLEITTLMSGLCALLFSWAILKNRLFNLIPVARELLMETLPLGVIAIDAQQRIQDINKVAKQYLGIDKDHLLGLSLTEFRAEIRAERGKDKLTDSGDSVRGRLLDALCANTEEDFQIDVTGEVFTSFRITRKEIASISGSQLIVISDITNDVQRQKELTVAKLKAEESDRLKSAFLANMSHEIRTPMNSIMGFISILQEDNLTEQEKTEYLTIVRSNGDRLLNTLNDIVDISKIESGQTFVNLSDFDINEVMINSYTLFMKEAEMKGLEFPIPPVIKSEVSYIKSDLEKIYSIVTNLIKNALKYTINGFVRFNGYISENELYITVCDSGVGIPKTKAMNIFDRFVQVESSHKVSFEGSGLGLAITKAYVELLGGSISVESEVDKGSTFFVRLPIQPSQIQRPY